MLRTLSFIVIFALLTLTTAYSNEPVNFEKIHCENPKEIVEFIRNFPEKDYKLYNVSGIGSFYIDKSGDHIKSHVVRGAIWEYKIHQHIKQYVKPGTIAIDIGAHIGTHTIVMGQAVGANGAVLAFEPQPKIFRELCMNLAHNNIRNVDLFWMALGDKKGQLELRPLKEGNEGATSFLEGKGNGQFVEMTNLDSLNLNNVSLIKIDVGLMESDVIDGAISTIQRNRPVIIADIQGPRQDITKEKLKNLGYNVTRIGCCSSRDYLALPQ